MSEEPTSNFKWTLRTIKATQLMAFAIIVVCLWHFLGSLNPYLSAILVFSSTSAALLMLVLAALEKGLLVHRHFTWNLAILAAVVALVTPALPLALLSLRELLDNENYRRFKAYKTIYSDVPLAPVTKVLLVLLASAATVGGYFFYEFNRNSAFFDVAFAKPRYHVPPKLSIKELYRWGGECNMEGKTECSIAVFLEILKRRPGDTKALANLAMAQSHFGQHKHALRNFQKAIRDGYDTYDLYLLYGNSLQAAGQFEGALAAYKTVLLKNPGLIDAAAKITLILVEQQKFHDALEFIDGYLKQNPLAQPRLRSVRDNLKAKIGEA